jgi:hypothetical protein
MYKSTVSTGSGVWMEFYFILFLKSRYSCTLLVTIWSANLELMWFIYALQVLAVVYGWFFYLFHSSSLVKAAPYLSPIIQLVLNWCDLHFHCRYRQCCMDGNFFTFVSQVWIKLHLASHQLFGWSWSSVIFLLTAGTNSGVQLETFLFLLFKSGYSCTLLVSSWSAGLKLMWFIYQLLVPGVVYGWKIYLFYFSSLVMGAPCLSPINRLVLNWCDLHIHCRYREWCMDGILFFDFSSLVVAAPYLSPVDQLALSWCDLYINYRYWEWCMDGKFIYFIS